MSQRPEFSTKTSPPSNSTAYYQRTLAPADVTSSLTFQRTTTSALTANSNDASLSAHPQATLTSLLREAQQHVQELLPHKEENSRMSTELVLLKDRLRVKEEESKKLQQLLSTERDERHRVIKAVMEEGSSLTTATDQRLRRLDEQLLEKKNENSALQREVERKTLQCKGLEEDVSHARQLRHEEAQKLSQATALALQLQHRVSSTDTQNDETSREVSRLEGMNKALVAQLTASESDATALRHELAHTKSKRDSLASENAHCAGKHQALQEQLDVLNTHSTHTIPQLRSEVASMISVRDELAETRKLLDTATTSLQTERSARRSAESERDELRMQIRARESELHLLESELHRTRCDAAERLSLRKECEETRDTLNIASRSANELQDQLHHTRKELSEKTSEFDAATTQITRELATLRNALETGVNSDELKLSTSNHSNFLKLQSVGVPTSVDVSGLVSDVASTATARSMPLSVQQQGVLWMLQPIRRAVMDVNISIDEGKSRYLAVTRQLEAASNKNIDLETTERQLNNQMSTLQMKSAEMANKLNDSQREVRRLEQQVQVLEDNSQRRFHGLVDALRLSDNVEGWDTLFTTAARVSQEAILLKEETTRLGETVGSQTKQIVALKQQHERTLYEMESDTGKRLQQLGDMHLLAMGESNEEKSALREALRRETERHEGTAKDLSALRLHNQSLLHELHTMRLEYDTMKSEVEARRKELTVLAKQVDADYKEKQALTEVLEEESRSKSRALSQVQLASDELSSQKQAATVLFNLLVGFVQTVIQLKIDMKCVIAERNYITQLSRMYEQGIAHFVQEHLAHYVRPKRSFRVAVIVVMAWKRLNRLSKWRRAFCTSEVQHGADSSPKLYFSSDGLSHKHRHQQMVRTKLPSLYPLHMSQIVSLPHFNDISESIQHVLALSEVDTTAPINSIDACDSNLFWKLSARALLVGPVMTLKTISGNLRRKMQLLKEDRASQEAALQRFKMESDTLHDVVRLKEEQAQSTASQLTRALADRNTLVDKRHFDQLSVELAQARLTLAQEKEDRKLTEDKLQQIRQREISLMATQSELQNEARALSIELAHKNVDSLSGLRTARGAPMSSLTSAIRTQLDLATPMSDDDAHHLTHRGSTPPRHGNSKNHMRQAHAADISAVSSLSMRQQTSTLDARDMSSANHINSARSQVRSHSALRDTPPAMHNSYTPPAHFGNNTSSSDAAMHATSADDLFRIIRGIDAKISDALHNHH